MTTSELELLVGIFVPLLVSVVKRDHFPDTANAVIALGVYVFVGIAAVVLQGQPLDIHNVLPSIATFTAEGTIAYQLFWKNWGDPQVTAAINAGTAPAA